MTSPNQNTILGSNEIINNTYEVNFFIGEGAFGEVYRVKHKFFDEYQVMKVFKENYVKNSDLNEVIEEGQILGKLSHPNVVKVHDINEFKKKGNNHYYITMSFVSGESLRQLVNRKIQLDLPAAISIMIDVLKGLKAAHENNPPIVHRDINTDNILISYDDSKPTGILGDFGIAKLMDRKNSLPGSAGRYMYFAPECFMNIYIPASDVFSVGIVFYKILTGVHPWEYDFDQDTISDNEIIYKMVNNARKAQPQKISLFNNDIDKKLEKVIMKSLNKDIEKRYSTAESFLKSLEEFFRQDDLTSGYWVEQKLN